MKTVDGTYSYDELEGFKPFTSERQYYGDPILTIREGMLNLNKAAADIVCRKKIHPVLLQRGAEDDHGYRNR